MDPAVARRSWRTLEPYHSMIYFVPEAAEAYRGIGLEGPTGYFASRAAAMGPVGAEVVVATFFNFNPALVRRSLGDVWERTTPADVLEARLAAVDRALRRLLPTAVGGAEVAEAAALARRAATGCRPEGRPLYAAHAALPWPDEDHLALWHAVTLLREFRGDGHVAVLTAEGVGGCEALLLHAGTGEARASVLRAMRAWPHDEWDAAHRRLVDRGWLDGDGGLTDAGRAHRDGVERRTDELALGPWEVLGEDGADRLRRLVRPWSQAITDAGTFTGRTS